MAYTKNYYHILGVDAPGWASTKQTPTTDLRRAYKLALLAAHPDKRSALASKTKRLHTVDDVKEAYTTLSNETSRAEYDNWLLRHPDVLRTASITSAQATTPTTDFILGLELLDLSDFDVSDIPQATASPTSTSTGSNTDTPEAQEGGMQWTRPCRCGADKGFRILEDELEDAERRGEKEVLVGCEGCSLWVRVAFEVEEG